MIGTLGTLVLLALPAAATTAVAAPPPVPPVLDVNAHAVLDWSVPDRWGASWQAWNSTTGYNANVINPRAWSMTLTGCASTSRYAVTGYTFTLARLGTTWTRTVTTPTCTLSLHNLPARGAYRATLTLNTKVGPFAGVSAPVTRNTSITDYLIVSMGDSLASGEGNPDRPGSYSYGVSIGFDHPPSIVVRTNKAAAWKDARCHRSAKSGPSLAAKAFEDASRYTSVTFVSVACSGAEMRHVISEPYAGQVPVGSSKEPAQIKAIADLVGPRARNGHRPIDALLVSAGINNLGFAGIINRCATNNNFRSGHAGCVYAGNLQTKIDDLTRQYAYLALNLAVGLPGTREVYLNTYPGEVFRGGGCGVLGGSPGGVHVPGLGIDQAEAQQMATAGRALNAKIAKASEMFRTDKYRWNLVPDLTAPFRPHAYCNNPSWFNRLEHSAQTQGDFYGTAHPNAAGHAKYAALLRSAVVVNQASQPYRRVTLTLDSLKAPSSSSGVPAKVDPVFWQYQNDPRGLTRPFSIPRNGRWTPVPASIGTYTWNMYPAPSSPRHATALNVTLGSILPIRHVRTDGYGAGSHELVHPAGKLAVRYHVTSASVGPPGIG